MNLEPVQEAVLAQAEAEGAGRVADAETRAAELVERARRDGERLVQEARAEAERAAELVGAHDLGEARRHARRAVLAAKRELYDQLRREVDEAAERLRRSDHYRVLLGRLAAAAAEQLGPEARLEIDPPREGGVVGAVDSRRVDYSLPALVERSLGDLGSLIESLWN